jgi:hypothetical protein
MSRIPSLGIPGALLASFDRDICRPEVIMTGVKLSGIVWSHARFNVRPLARWPPSLYITRKFLLRSWSIQALG